MWIDECFAGTRPSVNSALPETAPIVHFLYEPGDGGLDRVAVLLANGMARRGIPTELWLTKATGAVADLIAPEVKVRMVPTPKLGGRGVQLLLQIPTVARMIRRHKPKALFSAGNQTNLSIAIARKLAGAGPTKIIQKITNPVSRPGSGTWAKFVRRSRFGFTARMGDLCLTLSTADAEHYAQILPYAADKFHAVPNPYVSSDMLAAGDRRADRDPARPARLLAVGRIAPQKDILCLIAALTYIADRPWSLTILGDGPLLEQAQELAQKSGLAERIHFAGFVSDVTPHLAQSDILVLSSRWEGFPAVPIEAMATGCPVVATDCSPGLTRLLNDVGQETVAVRDPEALGRAIGLEIETPRSVAPLRTCATDYAIDNSVDQHLRLLERACAPH